MSPGTSPAGITHSLLRATMRQLHDLHFTDAKTESSKIKTKAIPTAPPNGTTSVQVRGLSPEWLPYFPSGPCFHPPALSTFPT